MQKLYTKFQTARTEIQDKHLHELVLPAKDPTLTQYKRDKSVYDKIAYKYRERTPVEICNWEMQNLEKALMMFFSFRYNFYWSLHILLSQKPIRRPDQDILINHLMNISNMALKRDKPSVYILAISGPANVGKSKLISGWEAFNVLRYPASSGIFASYDEPMAREVLGNYAFFINIPYQRFFNISFGTPNNVDCKTIKLGNNFIDVGNAESEQVRGKKVAYGPKSGTGRDGNFLDPDAFHLTGGVIIDDPMPKGHSQKVHESLYDYSHQFIKNLSDRLRQVDTGYVTYVGHKICVGDPIYEALKKFGGLNGAAHEIKILGFNDKTNQLTFPGAGGLSKGMALSLKKKAWNGDHMAKIEWFTKMQQEYVEDVSGVALTRNRVIAHVVQNEEYESMKEHLYKQVIVIDPSECNLHGNKTAMMILQIFTHAKPEIVSNPQLFYGGLYVDYGLAYEKIGDVEVTGIEHASKVVIRKVVADNNGLDYVQNQFFETIKGICIPGMRQIQKNGGDDKLKVIIEKSSSWSSFQSYLHNKLSGVFDLDDEGIELFRVTTGKVDDSKVNRWEGAKSYFFGNARLLPSVKEERRSPVIPHSNSLRLGIYKEDLPLSASSKSNKSWNEAVYEACLNEKVGDKHTDDDINDCLSIFYRAFWDKQMNLFGNHKSSFTELEKDEEI